MGQDLLQEGITAFQAGDRAKARELFMLVVEIDANNERAWYYLAVLESDATLRREYLERVISINPENQKAREVLERLKARETVPVEVAPSAPPPPPARSQPAAQAPKQSRIRSLVEEKPGAATTDGFTLPINIPGAPLRVSFESLLRDGAALLRSAFQTFGRASGVTLYTSELGKATWWRFWLLSGFVATICAVVALTSSFVIVVRYPQPLNSIFRILLTPLLTIPIILGMEFVGVYASYRWALTKNGGGSLLRHAYGIALRWTPLLVVYAGINFVLLILGASVVLPLFIIMALFAVVTIADGMDRIHAFIDPREKFFTAGIMFAGAIVAGVILAILLGALVFTPAIPYMIG